MERPHSEPPGHRRLPSDPGTSGVERQSHRLGTVVTFAVIGLLLAGIVLLFVLAGDEVWRHFRNPDELRQFAHRLKKFNADLREWLTALNRDMSALAGTWRDQEHQRFAQEFDEQLKMIARFLERSDRHVPYLVRKAEQIDNYLQS